MLQKITTIFLAKVLSALRSPLIGRIRSLRFCFHWYQKSVKILENSNINDYIVINISQGL
jgi:hypothetical protein